MKGNYIHMSLLIALVMIAMQTMTAQDNRQGTWLPGTSVKQQDKTTESVDKYLKNLQGSVRPVICDYDGFVLKSTGNFINGNAKYAESSWICSIQQNKVTGEANAIDLDVKFKITQGELRSGGVAVAFDFAGWNRNNYVLIPALVYNGNRYNVETNGYMAPYPEHYFYNKNVPLLISNSPRLSLKENTPGKIEALTGHAATPAMCFFSPAKKRGFILLTEQESRLDDFGMFIEENAAQNAISFVVSAPCVREQETSFGEFRKSTDKGVEWKAGDDLNMKFRIYNFSAKDIPDLLDKFMNVRKSLVGPNHPRNLTPFSYIAEITAKRVNEYRWREHPTESFYRNENSDGFQPGWVGGLMSTYPMLALNDNLSRDRVVQTYDFAVKKLVSKSGYFYGIYRDGKLLSDRENIPDATLVRKNSDILFWMIKHFELFKQQGYENKINPEWEKAAKGLADAFVKTWEKYGEFGNYVNVNTGDIIIFNSTSGAIAPAGLVLAGRYFKDPKYLEVAKQSAKMMYERDIVKQGMTSAHSGDIMQDPDADSAYGFVESLMALYYVTSDKQWLTMAETAANLGATWTLSYDYDFPETSTIGKLKGNMAGAVWASVQNKHAAPGICTSSGDYLFKLYRATGERLYADLIRDINHAHAEVMETPGRTTTGAGPGTSMERIQTSDADGKGLRGFIYNTSNGWTEGNGMLMALEIPGIYIQTDKDELYVFDHVDVKTIKRDKSGVTLEITNPTRFDAKVAIFAETSAQAKKPVGYEGFMNWRKVEVKSGDTVQIMLK